MAGFNLSQQVQVGGVSPHRVSALADDLSNLFGAVGQASQKYAQIGEQAAKLDFMDRTTAYNEELAQWKQGSVGQETNDAFWRAYDNRVVEMSAELVSERDKYQYNEQTYNTYNALALDYSGNLQMNMRPMLQKNELVATQTNYKTQALTAINTAIGAGVPLSIGEVSAMSDGAKAFQIDPTDIIDPAFSNSDSNATSHLLTDFNKFLKDNNIDLKGNKNQMAIANVVDKYYGSFAKLQDEELVANAPYTTNEHIQKVSAFLNKLYSAMDGLQTDQPNLHFRSVNSEATSTIGKIESGATDSEQIKLLRDETSKSILAFGGALGKTDTTTAKQTLQNLDNAVNKATKLDEIIDRYVGTSELNDYQSRGVDGIYVSTDIENNKSSVDVPVHFTDVQVTTALKKKVSNLDAVLIDQNGNINNTRLKTLTQVAKLHGVKSARIQGAMSASMRGVIPIGYNKNQAKLDINIASTTFEQGVTYKDITSSEFTKDYFSVLEAKVNSLKDDEKFIDNYKSAVGDAFRSMGTSKSNSSFALSNRSKVGALIANDTRSHFNLFSTLGNVDYYNRDNDEEYARLYATKYGTTNEIEADKLQTITQDNSYTFGNSIPLVGVNYTLPHIYSEDGLVDDKTVSKAINKELSALGVKSKFDKQTSIYTSYTDGIYKLNIIVKDKDGKIAKSKTYTGKELNLYFKGK